MTDLSLVRDALAAGSGERRIYLIRHVPDHGYKKGPKGARGCKATRSDLQPCNAARPHPAHYLPTANTALVNDWKVYQGALKHWKPYLIDLLTKSGLPGGLDSVLVEGVCVFPTRNPSGKGGRDQGNHRAFIEKALGDALVVGGWLESDSWERYEFGNLGHRIVRGERWEEFRLFPNALAG